MSQESQVTVERVIEAAPSDVWNAISTADQISEWFIQAEFEPAEGFQYTFTHEDTTITGTVLRCEPPALLEYTWNVSGIEGETKVLWRLTEVDAGTHVEIVHHGLDALGDAAAVMGGKFSEGWVQALDGLSEHTAGTRT